MSLLLRASNHQIVDKKNETEFALQRFSKTGELWSSKANWRLRFSVPSIILMDLLGNNLIKQVQKVMVCDLWLVDFDPFSVFSRFVACDRNYYWRQWKTQLWSRLLDFRVRVFVKRSVRFHFWISIWHLHWVILTQLWSTRPFQQKVLGTMVPPISQTAIDPLRENWKSSIPKWCGKKVSAIELWMVPKAESSNVRDGGKY